MGQGPYYEYKHPVINGDLAPGTSSIAGTNSRSVNGAQDRVDDSNEHGDISERGDSVAYLRGKRFPSLESWYEVVNDYEFQARCPIILKNSHRNKHFTFACHLRNCPFKILLSYCGNEAGGVLPQHPDARDLGESVLASLRAEHDPEKNEESTRDYLETDATDKTEPTRDYLGTDATDDNVRDAIAAAIDAVHDQAKQQDGSSKNVMQSYTSASSGPFMVTKIEPFHSHPLESNLSLEKFVLTKIPRILQYDLGFDYTLENLCNNTIKQMENPGSLTATENENSLSKFRISQYVEESGLLDIIKKRYGVTDDYLDKQFLGLIARRVTTYKARFVIKKKKAGVLKPTSSSTMAPEHKLSHAVLNAHHHALTSQSLITDNHGNSMGTVNMGQRSPHHSPSAASAAAAAAAVAASVEGSSNSSVHQHSTRGSPQSEPRRRSLDDSSISDATRRQENERHLHHSLNELDAQATAQAALKRTLEGAHDDLDYEEKKHSKKKANRGREDSVDIDDDHVPESINSPHRNVDQHLLQDDNVLSSLDEQQDDRLPHEVAEQLRLLSSHYTAENSATSPDVEADHSEIENHHSSSAAIASPSEEKPENEDDDNIQPELRGQ